MGSKSADLGYSIVQASDGGFVIVGSTGSYGGGTRGADIFLVKLKGDGNTCPFECNSGSGGVVYSGASVRTGGTTNQGGTLNNFSPFLTQGGTLINICQE